MTDKLTITTAIFKTLFNVAGYIALGLVAKMYMNGMLQQCM